MDYAAHQFVNMRTAGDGSSVGDHMAVVNQYPGKRAANAEVAPELPSELRYLWGVFTELHAARGSGMNANPISFGDMDAYGRLCDMKFQPWEVRAIRRVDVAFLTTVLSDGVGAPE